MSSLHGRRSFMSVFASFAGLLAFDRAGRLSAQAPPSAGPQFDLTWLDEFKGKHKQVYDYGSFDLNREPRPPLRFARNFLDTNKDVFGFVPPDVNTAIGISRDAFPVNASDAVWQKYQLGERWKIIDPETKQPAVRNIYLNAPGDGVKALQARGTVFWQCNVALNGVVQELARAVGKPAPEVRADLVAGLNPGVRLVPAHVLALGLVQERGFTYMKP